MTSPSGNTSIIFSYPTGGPSALQRNLIVVSVKYRATAAFSGTIELNINSHSYDDSGSFLNLIKIIKNTRHDFICRANV